MHSSKKILRVLLQTAVHANTVGKMNHTARTALSCRFLHRDGKSAVTVNNDDVVSSTVQTEFRRNVTGQSSHVSPNYLNKEVLDNQVPVPDYFEEDSEEDLRDTGRDSAIEGVFSGLESDFPCLRGLSMEGPEPDYDFVVSGYNVYNHEERFALKYRNGILPDLKIAYETWGSLNEKKDNAVLLFGGLSASSHAKSHKANRKKGWWEKFVGPGSALDTDKFFVICANHIGGCYGSSGPSTVNPITKKPYGTTFPLLTIADLVTSQFLLLDSLGIDRLHATVGSSLGGMCSVKAASLYPDRVGRVVSISACHSSHPSSIAMRYLQRKAIMIDPNWQQGHFYGTGKYPKAGMKMAREIATITYRSGPEWEQRFGRKHVDEEPSLCPFFEIEKYIDHQGETFSTKLDPNTLIYISKAMDLFDMRNGHSSLEEALHQVQCPVMVIGVKSDILFPVTQQRQLAEQLRKAGNEAVTYFELDSMYGHDTFLLDLNGVGTGVKGFVEALMTQNGKASD